MAPIGVVFVKNIVWLLVMSNLIFVVLSEKAIAVLSNDEGMKGIVYFSQATPNGVTTIEGKVFKLTPGDHGFHVHLYGDMRDDCGHVGAHYNPFKLQNGGDIGNIDVLNDGTAEFKFTSDQLPLSGENSCIGRALVVHAESDHKTNNLNGNIGSVVPKISCGVIGIQGET